MDGLAGITAADLAAALTPYLRMGSGDNFGLEGHPGRAQIATTSCNRQSGCRPVGIRLGVGVASLGEPSYFE